MSLEALDSLAQALGRLPGVGSRSAQRMSVKLAAEPERLLQPLVQALERVGREVRFCGECGAMTTVDRDPCSYCVDAGREDDRLCVVEDSADIDIIEGTGAFAGRYHVLQGKISPMQGEGPNDIRLRRLIQRVREHQVQEVILALSTDMEGDATSRFIAGLLRERGVMVTHLAYGIPAGSGIRYADDVTLARALDGRQAI